MGENVMIHYAMIWNQKYFKLGILLCGGVGIWYRNGFAHQVVNISHKLQ